VSRVEGEGPVHEGRTQIGKAIVLIVVAVLVAVLVLHHVNSGGATTSTGGNTSTSTTTTVAKTGKHKKPPKKKAKPLVAPSKIKLQVLNGLQSGSLAGNLSTKLKSKPGYETLPANNTTVADTTSEIYVVTPGYYREAKVLAAAVGLSDKSIHRGVPKTAPVPPGVTANANLVLVIGTSLKAKASTS
jgi:LytR cell envelope-related transcriptional attenuator